MTTCLQLGLFTEHSRALITMPRVSMNGEMMSPVFGVTPDGDVTLFAAVGVMDVDDVVADGRGRAELTAAVRAQIGFLLLETGLKRWEY